MKSAFFRSIFCLGILGIPFFAHSDPVFTTADPIGRVLTAQSEKQNLSYYCLVRDKDQTVNGVKPKCIISQYALSSKSGAVIYDDLGNSTEDGGWAPIGPAFNETTAAGFRNVMISSHPEAFKDVWAGLFYFPNGWQNEALTISDESMKEFINQLLELHEGTTERLTLSAAQYPSAGRVIENKLNGDKLDLVCLDVLSKGIPCRHFKTRFWHDGIPELIGSEMSINLPSEKIKDSSTNSIENGFDSRKPNYNPATPFLAAALNSNGKSNSCDCDNDRHYKGDGLGHYLGWPPGVSLVTGIVVASAGATAGLSFLFAGAALALLPAVDVTIGTVRNLTKAARRAVLTSEERHSAKQMAKAIDEFFDDSDTGENSLRIKDHSFQILKEAIVTGSENK